MNDYFSRNVIAPRVLDIFYSVYESIMNEKIQFPYNIYGHSNDELCIYIQSNLGSIYLKLYGSSLRFYSTCINKSENLSDKDLIKVRNCLLDLAQKHTDNILKQMNCSPTIDINEIEL